jgi:hypothetical protein
MYRRIIPSMFLLGGVLIGLVASGRIVLHAQDRAAPLSTDARRSQTDVSGETLPRQERPARAEAAAVTGLDSARAGRASVQDALVRSYRFPFSRPTTLAQVCLHLKETLGVPVVLDIAALDRQDVDKDDTVQLDLEGVRLKTGMKLLLDQVGLTYHVVPEDNLLIITDHQGSDDPLDRIWNELRTLHRDLHDVQDAVDELSDALCGDEQDGPRVRKPTIIEEKPDRNPAGPEPPQGEAEQPKSPGRKPGNAQSPVQPRGARPTPSRVPLASPSPLL